MAEDKSVHERRFEAAVKVMTSLPAHGLLVPSDDIKVMFYSYYKQATVGPCRATKPPVWNSLAKAKWEAWKALGDMPREQAMKEYVQEIQLILEIMPVTEEVADLLDVLEPFYEVVEDEDEEASKPAIPVSSAAGSNDEEDDEGRSTDEDLDDAGLEDSAEDLCDISDEVRQDFEIDPKVHKSSVKQCAKEDVQTGSAVHSACLAQPRSYGPTNREPNITTEAHGLVQPDTVSFGRGADSVNAQVAQALLRLQDDMQRVLESLSTLEAQKLSQVEVFLKRVPHSPSDKKPLLKNHLGMSPITLGFLLAWPFAVHWLVQLYRQRRRQR